jgi:hypothetical protein
MRRLPAFFLGLQRPYTHLPLHAPRRCLELLGDA